MSARTTKRWLDEFTSDLVHWNPLILTTLNRSIICLGSEVNDQVAGTLWQRLACVCISLECILLQLHQLQQLLNVSSSMVDWLTDWPQSLCVRIKLTWPLSALLAVVPLHQLQSTTELTDRSIRGSAACRSFSRADCATLLTMASNLRDLYLHNVHCQRSDA